ncbi:MAG: glutamate--tRNA ligase [Bacilli bacterium]|nr:glutamate--tRNA ligase [Bacilli bacterium]
MEYEKLANMLYPNVNKSINYYEEKYPERNLPSNAVVTRFAPSPTGFVHMGSLRTAFIAKKIAEDTKGVFFLRIEDTDLKRSVDNGIQGIIDDLTNFNIEIKEGRINETEDKGNYGPYLQSERKDIYQAYAVSLIEKNLAYPCFCNEDNLNEIRLNQESKKERLGYYGRYARCRYLSYEDIEQKIKKGLPFALRLKSPGNFNKKIRCHDLIKGKIDFPENDLDIVLLKSDGIPTYHFAHAIDDHLMRATHILRGDEWLSSFPIHVQLFDLLNFEIPKYCHLAPVNKKDGTSIRKLSKRKDPEAALSYYHEKGIPIKAVELYLMTTANSNFEEWLNQNSATGLEEFKFDFKKMSTSGSLFDLEKLLNISKNYISRLTAKEVYINILKWSSMYDKELYDLLKKYPEYSINILNIEREQKKPRKDFASWSEVKDNIWYMYDELYKNENIDFNQVNASENYVQIINLYINKYYNYNDDKENWFIKIKKLSEEVGFASDMKLYKERPSNYKGSVADISNILRIALTTKTVSPDLFQIMKLLGEEKIIQRFKKICG